MNTQTFETLQFDRIKKEVANRAIGDYTKIKVAHLQPQTQLDTVRTWQEETQEARFIIESGQHVPFMGLVQISRLLTLVEKGGILTPPELVEVADFLRSSRMMRQFFEKNREQAPLLYQYSQALPHFLVIEETIYQKIQHNRLVDEASKTLRRARRLQQETEKEIQEKLMKFIRHPKHAEMLQEKLIIKKGEHYTIPIKASYKNKISGTLIEASEKGQTVFVEPSSVAKLNEKNSLLQAEIIAEEYQLLAELTGLLAENQADIDLAIEAISAFDIIFAKAKYSRELNSVTPIVKKNETFEIKEARHPFLTKEAVPLTIKLGQGYRGLVITGANAGGKTVVLKTVGLFTLMTMFGLQLPVAKGTIISVMEQVFVDIGDQQSLDNALSTFSGHMQNIATVLKQSKRHTLVLLDEIGSGTEPNEGAGLAIAIMEQFYQQGALILATTHYGEIKRFAEEHADFMPAAMAFDKETLTPKYHLHIGKTGESQALWIAKKMHMSASLLKRAAHYIETKDYALEKQAFEQIKEPSVKTADISFNQGDRVFLTETKETGIVYEIFDQKLTVLVGENWQEVSKKRVQLVLSATELYPEGYEMAQLFVDYQTRKVTRDLERGSKKAHKQLRKASLERKNDRQD